MKQVIEDLQKVARAFEGQLVGVTASEALTEIEALTLRAERAEQMIVRYVQALLQNNVEYASAATGDMTHFVTDLAFVESLNKLTKNGANHG